jgi:hypothetical protein
MLCVPRRVQEKEHEQLLTWLTERALEHDKPTLLLQMTSEHLKQQQMLRPGVTVLERLMVTARTQAHHASFHRLQPLLTPDCMALLDRLLVPEQEMGKTPLSLLRQQCQGKKCKQKKGGEQRTRTTSYCRLSHVPSCRAFLETLSGLPG